MPSPLESRWFLVTVSWEPHPRFFPSEPRWFLVTVSWEPHPRFFPSEPRWFLVTVSWEPHPRPSVLPFGTPLVPGDRILTPSPNTSHLVFRGFLKSADPHCLFFCHLLDSCILSIPAVCGRMPALRRHPNSVVLFYLPDSCILEIPVFCGSPLSVAGYPHSANIQILLFCGLSDPCVLRIPVFRGSPLSVVLSSV